LIALLGGATIVVASRIRVKNDIFQGIAKSFITNLAPVYFTNYARNGEVLLRVKEQRNILYEISKRKTNWIGHILRRNCLVRQVTEGKIKGGIEVTGRLGRRRRKLLDDLNLLTPSGFFTYHQA
jgi:hypothetical protein